MIRAALLLALLGGFVAAETTAPDIAASVIAARRNAEDELAKQRLVIASERSALMASVQEAHRLAGTQRERLHIALRERDERAVEVKRRKQEVDRESALVRTLVDRAVVASQMSDDQAKALAKAAPGERLAAAITAMQARVARLPGLLTARLANEPVITRDGMVKTVPVLHLGAARAVALGGDHASRGLLVRAGDGTSLMVAGAALPAEVITAHHAMPALLPLDPDGMVAHQHASQHRTLAQWLKGGRFFIWPILGLFATGLLIAVSRMIALYRLRVDPRRLIVVADLLNRGEHDRANELVAAKVSSLDRVLAAGIAARSRPREQREAVLEQALMSETPRLQKGLAVILVLAGIAPLLGLLGTVTGMIDMFGVIAQQGSGNAKSLSGAISEALITTQAGMLAAIPLLLIHALLSRVVERRLLLLDEAACGMLGLAEHGDPAPAAR